MNYSIDVTVSQFKKLPPILQTAVGNAVLRELARIERILIRVHPKTQSIERP
jgi:hypothetical protein